MGFFVISCDGDTLPFLYLDIESSNCVEPLYLLLVVLLIVCEPSGLHLFAIFSMPLLCVFKCAQGFLPWLSHEGKVEV